MLAWISVALVALLLRSAAIALLTSATSASGVSGAAAGASGTASLLLESDLSLDLLAATFFPLAFPALPADLVVADELLRPRAAAVSVATVTASRRAHAGAATSAAWRRFATCVPPIPGELLRARACTRSPYETDLTYDLGGKAVSKRHHAARSMAPGRTRAGSGYLADGRGNGHCSVEHRASDEINNNVG